MVHAFTDRKTRGKEVTANIQVNSKCKVSSVHSKRAWNEDNGANAEAFRESFRRIDHLFNYLDANGKCAVRISWSKAEAEMRRLPVDQ